MAVKAIPEGYGTVTPYLVVSDTAAQIEFIESALGGSLNYAMRMPDGTPMHAEVQLGTSKVMLGMAGGEHSPPLTAMLYVYVEDVDAAHAQAVKAGATSFQEPTDMFYGDRTAGLTDGNGNKWYLATHVEDVSEEDLGKRAAAEMAKGCEE